MDDAERDRRLRGDQDAMPDAVGEEARAAREPAGEPLAA
jgi:hypothetical protein